MWRLKGRGGGAKKEQARILELLIDHICQEELRKRGEDLESRGSEMLRKQHRKSGVLIARCLILEATNL